MEVNITHEGAQTIAQLIGRLDTPAAQEVSTALAPLQEKADGTIILDCSQMT